MRRRPSIPPATSTPLKIVALRRSTQRTHQSVCNRSASNEEDTMKHSRLWTIPLMAVLAFLPLPTVAASGQDNHGSHHGDWRDDDDKDRRDNDKAPLSVTVSFGAGLNTGLAGPNPDNDHILPPKIEVKAGGVVNFVVAGFHQIFAYNPGVKPKDVE
jgi:hypothetical protein